MLPLTSLPPEGVPPSPPTTNQTPPVPSAPIYSLGDPRQWVSYLLDKAPVTVITWYVLTRIEPVLQELVQAQIQTRAAVEAMTRAVERISG
jgi:hypothetical protein